jgi:hypothetical protein
MSHAPWSISKANVAHECTLRFHLRYTKRAAGRRIENSAGRIGTAVHEILERMLRGEDFRMSFMSAAMENLTRNETLELKTHEVGIKRFFDIFAKWRDKMGRPEVYPELQLAITKDLTETGYWDDDCYFRGVLDVSCVVTRAGGDKYAIIIDHKSGDVSDIEKYEDQLDAYVALASIIYPEVVGAQAAIHWVKAQEALDQKTIAWGQLYMRPQIETHILPKFLGHLEAAEELVQARPTPTEGWYCQFCEYQDSCPIK